MMDATKILFEMGYAVIEYGRAGGGWQECRLDELPPSIRDDAGDMLVGLMRETGRTHKLYKKVG